MLRAIYDVSVSVSVSSLSCSLLLVIVRRVSGGENTKKEVSGSMDSVYLCLSSIFSL